MTRAARERRGDCLTSNAVDVNVAFGTTRTTRQHTATLNARGRKAGFAKSGGVSEIHSPARGCFVIAKKRRTSEPRLFGDVMSQRCIEMEDQAMSLIQKGYAVSTRGGFLGALFSALLALALLHPGTRRLDAHHGGHNKTFHCLSFS